MPNRNNRFFIFNSYVLAVGLLIALGAAAIESVIGHRITEQSTAMLTIHPSLISQSEHLLAVEGYSTKPFASTPLLRQTRQFDWQQFVGKDITASEYIFNLNHKLHQIELIGPHDSIASLSESFFADLINKELIPYLESTRLRAEHSITTARQTITENASQLYLENQLAKPDDQTSDYNLSEKEQLIRFITDHAIEICGEAFEIRCGETFLTGNIIEDLNKQFIHMEKLLLSSKVYQLNLSSPETFYNTEHAYKRNLVMFLIFSSLIAMIGVVRIAR